MVRYVPVTAESCLQLRYGCYSLWLPSYTFGRPVFVPKEEIVRDRVALSNEHFVLTSLIALSATESMLDTTGWKSVLTARRRQIQKWVM